MAISRRRMMTLTAAASAATLAPLGAAWAGPPRLLVATPRTMQVKGRSAKMYGLYSDRGSHGLVIAPGDRLTASLVNRLSEPTLIHWHGMTPPWAQDGVPDAPRPALQPGETRRYDFAVRPGTHWMHSHVGLQDQKLLSAPLIVETKEDKATDERSMVLIVKDFTFKDPAEILAGLRGPGGHTGHGAHAGHGAPAVDHAAMGHGAPTSQGAGGNIGAGAPGGHDPNDVRYDAHLVNDRCLDDPEEARVGPGENIRLRIINAASATNYWVDLGPLTASLIAVDGNPVTPVDGSRFPLAMAQRLDLRLTLPDENGVWPVFFRPEGTRERTALLLATFRARVAKVADQADDVAPLVDLSLERRLSAATPLAERPVDRRDTLVLGGGEGNYDWTIDGRRHGQHRPIPVKLGERVELTFRNPSAMAHPMHLHGHHFQVVGIDGAAFAGAMRDTVQVPPGAAVTVRFDADNPGRWMLHCHHLYHMNAGMMTELVYQEG